MPVWQATMNAAAPSFGGEKLTPPASVVRLNVCAASGQQATQFCQEHVEDVNTGTIRSRSTAFAEYFRKGTENMAFCSVHSGALGDGATPDTAVYNLPALDAVPVRPKQPVLLGDDPYHTESPSFAATSAAPGLIRRRTNVLDSLDLGEVEESIPLKRPQRLQIKDD
jgi:penicillin-binding protein 1A